MSHILFNPFVGENYEEGVKTYGKKLMVLGASYYCTLKTCPNHVECTSFKNGRWQSRGFVTRCMTTDGNPYDMRNTLADDHDYEGARSFLRFPQLLNHHQNGRWDIDNEWNRMLDIMDDILGSNRDDQ